MEQSKHSQEILNLGKKIVDDLKLQETNDTLSRWMAHYISEKMIQVEQEKDPDEKKEVQKELSDLIIKIWDRRKIQLQSVNPLNDIKQALKILKLFRKKQNDFWGFQQDEFNDDMLVEFASKVNDSGFKILKISLLLSLLPDKLKKVNDWKKETESLLSKEEKELIKLLNLFLDDFPKIKFIINAENEAETEDERNYLEKAMDKIEELLIEQKNSFDQFKSSMEDKGT